MLFNKHNSLTIHIQKTQTEFESILKIKTYSSHEVILVILLLFLQMEIFSFGVSHFAIMITRSSLLLQNLVF